MALIQMPQYNEDLHYQELNNIIAELEAKLKATQVQLAETCAERDAVSVKVQEAMKLIDQRERSVRKIETQVRELHGLAKILQKENAEYKAVNAQLTQSLTETQNNLETVQQNYADHESHSEVVEKITALEASLSEMLNEMKESEQAGFDSVYKKIGLVNDAGFQMKVLAALNALDRNTSRLRNYNDTRCMSELDKLGRKIDHVDKLVNDNRFIGVLCVCSVGIGIMLAKLLL